jgi:hypothetical protein
VPISSQQQNTGSAGKAITNKNIIGGNLHFMGLLKI